MWLLKADKGFKHLLQRQKSPTKPLLSASGGGQAVVSFVPCNIRALLPELALLLARADPPLCTPAIKLPCGATSSKKQPLAKLQTKKRSKTPAPRGLWGTDPCPRSLPGEGGKQAAPSSQPGNDSALKQELRVAGGLPPSPLPAHGSGEIIMTRPRSEWGMNYRIAGAGFEMETSPCRVETAPQGSGEGKIHALGQKAEGQDQERTLYFP